MRRALVDAQLPPVIVDTTVEVGLDADNAKADMQLETTEAERLHASGYALKPVLPVEFDIWEKEQDWGAV